MSLVGRENTPEMAEIAPDRLVARTAHRAEDLGANRGSPPQAIEFLGAQIGTTCRHVTGERTNIERRWAAG
jgi:hypothetical protein